MAYFSAFATATSANNAMMSNLIISLLSRLMSHDIYNKNHTATLLLIFPIKYNLPFIVNSFYE